MLHAETRLRRVLMTADAVGGVWTYASDLAGALGADGIDVHLAVLGPSPSIAQRARIAALPGITLHEHPGRLEWMEDPWGDVAAAGEWLLDLERTCRPDVIHLNGYVHGALPWSSPVLIVGHSCVRSWWRAVKGEDAPPRLDRYRAEVTTGLRAADMVVAPSGAMLSMLQTHYGPLERTHVITNGRQEHGRTPVEKEPFVLTAGRLWDAAKNVDAVCTVAPRLAWRVYVAGDAGGAALPGDSVHQLGSLSGEVMARWMDRASIYALPARYEPFGLSALEAAQSGCALVLGDIDSLREIWADTAFYVDPEDPDHLAYAIGRLIEHDAERKELGARARVRSRTFSLPRMCASYRDAYGWLLEERPRTASHLPAGERGTGVPPPHATSGRSAHHAMRGLTTEVL